MLLSLLKPFNNCASLTHNQRWCTIFEVYRPSSLRDALEFLYNNAPDVKPLAGGTELLLLIRDKKIPPPRVLLDLSPLKRELSFVEISEREVRIGALTTAYELSLSPLHRDVRFAGFVDAWKKFGTLAVRTAATIGGNVATATQYSDYLTLLMVYNAKIKALGINGERLIPIEDFVVDSRKTALEPHEIISEVIIETPPPNTSSAFIKFDRRQLLIAGIITCATYMTMNNGVIEEVRVSYDMIKGKRAPGRAREVEVFLRGKQYTEELVETAANKVLPRIMERVTDWWTTSEYRLEMSKVALKRGLRIVKSRIESGRI